MNIPLPPATYVPWYVYDEDTGEILARDVPRNTANIMLQNSHRRLNMRRVPTNTEPL